MKTRYTLSILFIMSFVFFSCQKEDPLTKTQSIRFINNTDSTFSIIHLYYKTTDHPSYNKATFSEIYPGDTTEYIRVENCDTNFEFIGLTEYYRYNGSWLFSNDKSNAFNQNQIVPDGSYTFSVNELNSNDMSFDVVLKDYYQIK